MNRQRFSSARATGLEPATTGSTVRYSNQLSYAPVAEFLNVFVTRVKSSGHAVSRCGGGLVRKRAERRDPTRVSNGGQMGTDQKAGDGIRTHDVQLGKLAFYH
jgi:hypothetical protein